MGIICVTLQPILQFLFPTYIIVICNYLYQCSLQELLCALRLAIENDNQDRVVDAFLDRHPDVKPGLRGAPEIDWPDKVCTKMNIAVCCVGALIPSLQC